MILTIGTAVVLGIIRIWMGFNVPTESFQWAQLYKDIAHLFMGGLAVSAWIDQPWSKKLTWKWKLFWLLNIVEVTVAVLSRM